MDIVVVLGMHKSGTSLVAETLHHSGIAMVEALKDGGYDKGEKYERRESGAINKALLNAENAYSLDVRTELDPKDADKALVARARTMIEALDARGEDWGFKDPRTCMTWDVWKPLLPAHRLVCVFRDVEEVHHRYRHKPMFSAHRSLDAWVRYNEAMLRAYEAAPADARLLVDYRDLMEGEGMAALSAFLGRPLIDRRIPSMRRNSKPPMLRTRWEALLYRLRTGRSVWALNGELRRLARSPRRPGADSRAAPAPRP